jgi:hypothetical protein
MHEHIRTCTWKLSEVKIQLTVQSCDSSWPQGRLDRHICFQQTEPANTKCSEFHTSIERGAREHTQGHLRARQNTWSIARHGKKDILAWLVSKMLLQVACVTPTCYFLCMFMYVLPCNPFRYMWGAKCQRTASKCTPIHVSAICADKLAHKVSFKTACETWEFCKWVEY